MAQHRKGNGKRKKALGLTEVSRICVSCRQRQTARKLLRFVRGADGRLGLDLARTLPGRGAWLCATQSCLKQGFAKESFKRSLEGPISSDFEETKTMVTEVLTNAVKSQLGLGFRAGQLLVGRETVFAALKANEISFIICARDLSPRSWRDVQKVLEKTPKPCGLGPTQLEIGQAIGRGVTGIMGLSGQGFRQSLSEAITLLQRWMGWEMPHGMNSEMLGESVPVMGMSPQASAGPIAPQRSV